MTDAKIEMNERQRRLEQEALNRALANKQCPKCATTGCWTVYDRERTKGRVRYIRCKGCGHPDRVSVILPKAEPAAGGSADETPEATPGTPTPAPVAPETSSTAAPTPEAQAPAPIAPVAPAPVAPASPKARTAPAAKGGAR